MMFKRLIVFISNLSSLFLTLIGIEPLWIKTEYSAILQWQFVSVRKLSKRNNFNNCNKRKIAIVAFRNNTWFGWAVYAAHYLRIIGCNPVILYSEKELNEIFKNEPLHLIGLSFKRIFKKSNIFEKVNIDDYFGNLYSSGNDNDFIKVVESYAHTLAGYDLKVEEFESHYEVNRYNAKVEVLKKDILLQFGSVESVLKKINPELLLCPSGLIGISVVYLEIAKRYGISSYFVEAWAQRPGHLIWSKNNPALLYDIKGWMKTLGPWDTKKLNEYNTFAKFQEGFDVNDTGDKWLEKFHRVQRSKKNEGIPHSLKSFLHKDRPVFLCATNVVGDSSTLRRDAVFKNQKEWLNELCNFFKNHKELSLIIRAHPDEIWQKSKIKLGDYAKEICKGLNNVYVIPGESNINSYSLVNFIDGGLVWMSNIGLDILIRNKPVLVAARPKYENLGLLDPPVSKKRYFDLILDIVNKKITPSKQQIELAKYYQLILFKYMSLEATSSSYRLIDYRIPMKENLISRSTFYEIMSGNLDMFGRNTFIES